MSQREPMKKAETTRLSSKGQLIIPKSIREAHGWSSGMEFTVVDTDDGVLLRPRKLFPETRVEDVAGCLFREGLRKSDDEIKQALKRAARERWRDSG